ncbi:hypothetical protein BC828DRAFT_391085 [Blastocladiella britannica]|nr:hypothetical protein BC828DRAFT_391085 [Blastocladiella britannica]
MPTTMARTNSSAASSATTTTVSSITSSTDNVWVRAFYASKATTLRIDRALTTPSLAAIRRQLECLYSAPTSSSTAPHFALAYLGDDDTQWPLHTRLDWISATRLVKQRGRAHLHVFCTDATDAERERDRVEEDRDFIRVLVLQIADGAVDSSGRERAELEDVKRHAVEADRSAGEVLDRAYRQWEANATAVERAREQLDQQRLSAAIATVMVNDGDEDVYALDPATIPLPRSMDVSPRDTPAASEQPDTVLATSSTFESTIDAIEPETGPVEEPAPPKEDAKDTLDDVSSVAGSEPGMSPPPPPPAPPQSDPYQPWPITNTALLPPSQLQPPAIKRRSTGLAARQPWDSSSRPHPSLRVPEYERRLSLIDGRGPNAPSPVVALVSPPPTHSVEPRSSGRSTWESRGALPNSQSPGRRNMVPPPPPPSFRKLLDRDGIGSGEEDEYDDDDNQDDDDDEMDGVPPPDDDDQDDDENDDDQDEGTYESQKQQQQQQRHRPPSSRWRPGDDPATHGSGNHTTSSTPATSYSPPKPVLRGILKRRVSFSSETIDNARTSPRGHERVPPLDDGGRGSDDEEYDDDGGWQQQQQQQQQVVRQSPRGYPLPPPLLSQSPWSGTSPGSGSGSPFASWPGTLTTYPGMMSPATSTNGGGCSALGLSGPGLSAAAVAAATAAGAVVVHVPFVLVPASSLMSSSSLPPSPTSHFTALPPITATTSTSDTNRSSISSTPTWPTAARSTPVAASRTTPSQSPTPHGNNSTKAAVASPRSPASASLDAVLSRTSYLYQHQHPKDRTTATVAHHHSPLSSSPSGSSPVSPLRQQQQQPRRSPGVGGLYLPPETLSHRRTSTTITTAAGPYRSPRAGR